MHRQITMSQRTKIIVIILVVLLLLGLAALIYYLFFTGPKMPEQPGDFPPPTEEEPPIEEPPAVIPEGPPSVFEPILRQLSTEPVSGAVLGNKSGVAVVRYQDSASGNVHEIGADAEGRVRLTNTTIPKVYETLWSKSGTSLIARYVRDGSESIESFSGRIVPGQGSGEGELKGSFLARNISDLTVAPDGASIFYLQTENGVASGIRSDFAGNGKVKLWASPMHEWLASWPSQGRILLLSKPSALAEGMLLSLDPVRGGTRLLLRGITGLTALGNPVREDLLYSESTNNGIALSIWNAATGRARTVDITTLPEKCAWAKDGETLYCGVPKIIPPGSYPDVWYQGVISWSDEVWSTPRESGASYRIADLEKKRGSPIDVTNPQISADEKFLIFTDKESGTLWSLQMTP